MFIIILFVKPNLASLNIDDIYYLGGFDPKEVRYFMVIALINVKTKLQT